MRTDAQLLQAFSQAWTDQDVDRIVGRFSRDGVFFASSSYGARQKACGHDEIRLLTETMFETDDGAVFEVSDQVVFEGGAVTRWRYALPSGTTELGCDYCRLEGGLITLKDAYRKIGPLVRPL